MPIKGIDISNHQKGVNLKNYKNQGFEICIIKATEGKSYISPTLDEQFKEAKAAGFKVGFYHFANNRWNSLWILFILNYSFLYPDGKRKKSREEAKRRF